LTKALSSASGRVFAGFDDHLAGWSEAALAVAYGVFHQFGIVKLR